MIILGVNPGLHDGSAALVVDGRLARVVEAERVTGSKRSLGRSPAPAVTACLAAEGLTLASVDVVAAGWNVPNFPDYPGETYTADERAAVYEWLLDPDGTWREMWGDGRRRKPRSPLPADWPPLRFVAHHDAHAYSALLVSGLSECSVIVADGRGELASTSIGVIRDGRLAWVRDWPLHQSLGQLYAVAAKWAGMTLFDAGKLMGLAAYGRPQQGFPIRTDDGYSIDVSGLPAGPLPGNQESDLAEARLLDWFSEHHYPYRRGDRAEPMAYAHFAATIQDALERSMTGLYRLLEQSGGSDRLLVSGGVGMNCTMIGGLTRTAGIDDLFVPPFAYDAGVAVGAALTVAADLGDLNSENSRLRSADLGLDFTTEEIAAAVQELDGQRFGETDLLDQTAELLADGAVVGWFQGRAEAGQRALGNRSIIASPRDRATLVRVNTLKGREMWRPLAPSALAEHLPALFEVGRLSSPYDFMLAAAQVRPDARRLIPATVHVDGTARPQAVSRDTNRRYWELIDRFRRRTGVPAVLNTSFNLAGSPIVNSPQDAVRTFLDSTLDALVIGDYLVTRSPR